MKQIEKLIDTHTHLFDKRYDLDKTAVLERTWHTCQAVICVGTDLESSRQAIKLSESDERIFASVGIHPHELNDSPTSLEELVSNRVVAIGECGMDFKDSTTKTKENINSQRQLLEYQINLANKLNLPVIIHARECFEELIPILQDLKPRSGVVHSWTGTLVQAQQIFNLGMYLSFSGMLTYPANETIRQVAKLAPPNKVILETDCPYLPPQQIRGQINEPANVKMVADKLSQVWNKSLGEIITITTSNARKLFSLP